jgi:IS30 family transposase
MQSTPRHYQQLQPEERVTLASLVQQKFGIREMAGMLNRSPSTISRELSRNSGTEGYASAQAREQVQRRSTQRRKAARPAIKLHADALLFDVVCHFLRLLWSPEQIALTLAHIFPKGHEHRVSHETIYNCIYAHACRRVAQGPDRLSAPSSQGQAHAT